MYAWLQRRLPTPLAELAAALWYALLIVATYLLWDLPQAPFRYLVL